jgi:hypothetical protein
VYVYFDNTAEVAAPRTHNGYVLCSASKWPATKADDGSW